MTFRLKKVKLEQVQILGINFITVNESRFLFFRFDKHCIFSTSQSGRFDLKNMTNKEKFDVFSQHYYCTFENCKLKSYNLQLKVV